MPRIDQQICIVIQREQLRSARLSYPTWDQSTIDRSFGLVRDYDRAVKAQDTRTDLPHLQNPGWIDRTNRRVLNPNRAYDVGSRRDYHAHVGSAPEEGIAALAVGNGNLLSNLGIVGWADGLLLKVAWEEHRINSGWEYSCFYATRDGRTGIGRFTFNTGSPQPVEDFNGELAWVTSGQPILWDGVVVHPEDLIAETYDVRHVYRLPTTVGTPAQQRRARQLVGDLTELWVKQLGQPSAQATRVLRDWAEERRLVTESRYFMGALGADEEGWVYIVQRHGSMSEIAQTLRDRGATRAILLDQGGGVGTFYWCQRHCPRGEFILRGRDLRPERLSVIVFHVNDTWNEA